MSLSGEQRARALLCVRGKTETEPQRSRERGRGSLPSGSIAPWGRGLRRLLHQPWRRRRGRGRAAIKYCRRRALVQVGFWSAVPALPPAQLPSRRDSPDPSMPQPRPPAAAMREAPRPPPSPCPRAEQLRINRPFDAGGVLPGTRRSGLADGGDTRPFQRPGSRSLPTAPPPITPGRRAAPQPRAPVTKPSPSLLSIKNAFNHTPPAILIFFF